MTDLLILTVETVTGQRILVKISAKESILSLKAKIWHKTGISPYNQGLIFGEKSLSHDEDTFESLGIGTDAHLKLAILARSGSINVNNDSNSKACKMQKFPVHHLHGPSTSKKPIDLSDEDNCPLNLSFTVEKQTEARAKVDENRRTMAKMRELRQNLHNFKLGRTTYSSGGPFSTPLKTRHLPSAPEDTSAKESSPGDTECEESRPVCLLKDGHQRPIVRTNCQTANRVGTNSTFVAKGAATSKTHHNWPKPTRQRASYSMSFLRLLESSSSEVEGSGAVWTTTGDEAQEYSQQTVEEKHDDHVDQPPVVHDDDHLDIDVPAKCPKSSPLKSHSPTVDFPSDPSEFSSGVLVCDLNNAFRRLKVKKRHHVAVNRGGTRSKSKSLFAAKVDSASEISSSDENSKRKSPVLVGSNWGARKSSNFTRTTKKTLAEMTFRMHRQPQSSQSQQRCNTCGCKLNVSATFQCRCGKSLCLRHRPPELHMCSKVHKSSLKMQNVSD